MVDRNNESVMVCAKGSCDVFLLEQKDANKEIVVLSEQLRIEKELVWKLADELQDAQQQKKEVEKTVARIQSSAKVGILPCEDPPWGAA